MLVSTELGANPLANSGIGLGAFNAMSSLYVGIAEAKLTAVPKGRLSLATCWAYFNKRMVEASFIYSQTQNFDAGQKKNHPANVSN